MGYYSTKSSNSIIQLVLLLNSSISKLQSTNIMWIAHSCFEAETNNYNTLRF